MSTAVEKETETTTPALYLAEYDSPGTVLHAATIFRDAGYTSFDSHTPFPIHGMDAAMGLKDSKLGLVVFPMAILGCSLGFLMMWWMNGVDYPIVIGGKPPYSLPSQIPIMFELTILFSALTTVFGMFAMNKLPRHHHPIFNSDRFRGFSDDKFFLSVESDDPKWHIERTKTLLDSTHPNHVELVNDDDEGGSEFDASPEGAH